MAGIIIFLVALVSVTFQAHRTVAANPATILGAEK
jgi:hypothetical protein